MMISINAKKYLTTFIHDKNYQQASIAGMSEIGKEHIKTYS